MDDLEAFADKKPVAELMALVFRDEATGLDEDRTVPHDVAEIRALEAGLRREGAEEICECVVDLLLRGLHGTEGYRICSRSNNRGKKNPGVDRGFVRMLCSLCRKERDNHTPIPVLQATVPHPFASEGCSPQGRDCYQCRVRPEIPQG